MTSSENKPRALALFSGGLDSLLAVAVVVREGVEVVALHFVTGFSAKGRMAPQAQEPAYDRIVQAAASVGARAEVIDLSGPFVEVVTNPRHGYGRFANPCIDCKIMMLRKAKELLGQYGARFVLTGEVLGQRPMSQHLPVLNLIEKESGLRGLLLRPLSAKLLKPTIPELEGWVSREHLYAFKGRSRKPQMALAAELGITSFAQPAGGCLLTDENVARRLRDLFAHRDKGAVSKEDLHLAMYGRHFRISQKVKAVVGRDEWDNVHLEQLAGDWWKLRALDYQGPLTLVEPTANPEELSIAAELTARYSDGKHQSTVRVLAERAGKEMLFAVTPLCEDEVNAMRV